MRAQEIMTENPRCVTADATVREAAQLMRDEDVGLVPVVESNTDKRLVGVITDRDIAIRCIAEGRDSSCRVRDAMSRDRLTTCAPQDAVNDVMKSMASEKVRRIPIVDERGSLVGIVAQADIVRKATSSSDAERTIEQISEPGGPHAH